jgi:hypothetical protein
MHVSVIKRAESDLFGVRGEKTEEDCIFRLEAFTVGNNGLKAVLLTGNQAGLKAHIKHAEATFQRTGLKTGSL